MTYNFLNIYDYSFYKSDLQNMYTHKIIYSTLCQCKINVFFILAVQSRFTWIH